MTSGFTKEKIQHTVRLELTLPDIYKDDDGVPFVFVAYMQVQARAAMDEIEKQQILQEWDRDRRNLEIFAVLTEKLEGFEDLLVSPQSDETMADTIRRYFGTPDMFVFVNSFVRLYEYAMVPPQLFRRL